MDPHVQKLQKKFDEFWMIRVDLSASADSLVACRTGHWARRSRKNALYGSMTRMGHDSGLSAHVQCAKHIMGLRWIEMMKMLMKIVIGNRIIIKMNGIINQLWGWRFVTMYECSCSQPIQVYVVSLSHPLRIPCVSRIGSDLFGKGCQSCQWIGPFSGSCAETSHQGRDAKCRSHLPPLHVRFNNHCIRLHYIYIYCIYYVILYALNELQLKWLFWCVDVLSFAYKIFWDRGKLFHLFPHPLDLCGSGSRSWKQLVLKPKS